MPKLASRLKQAQHSDTPVTSTWLELDKGLRRTLMLESAVKINDATALMSSALKVKTWSASSSSVVANLDAMQVGQESFLSSASAFKTQGVALWNHQLAHPPRTQQTPKNMCP